MSIFSMVWDSMKKLGAWIVKKIVKLVIEVVKLAIRELIQYITTSQRTRYASRIQENGKDKISVGVWDNTTGAVVQAKMWDAESLDQAVRENVPYNDVVILD